MSLHFGAFNDFRSVSEVKFLVSTSELEHCSNVAPSSGFKYCFRTKYLRDSRSLVSCRETYCSDVTR